MTYTSETGRLPALLRVGLFMLVCAVLLAAAAPMVQGRTGASAELLVGAVTGVGTLAVTLLSVRWDHLRPSDIGVVPTRKSPRRMLVGVVAGLVLVMAWAGLWALTGTVRWVPLPGPGPRAVILQGAAFVLLATREELAFHGYPLRRLQRAFGLWPAQVLVALVFAAEHRLGGVPWTQAVLGAGVGSLLFGMAALASNGLAMPIGMHAAWNVGHWALGMKESPGAGEVWRALVEPGRERSAQVAGTGAYILVMGTAILGLWCWWKRRQSKADTPDPSSAIAQ